MRDWRTDFWKLTVALYEYVQKRDKKDEEYIDSALYVLKKDREIGTVCTHIEELLTKFNSQGNPEDSLVKIYRGLKKIDDEDFYGAFGNISLVLNCWDVALNFFKQFLAIQEHKQQKDKSGISAAYMNIGIVFREKGDLRTAENYYEKSIEILKDIGSRSNAAEANMELGVLYSLYDRFDESLVLLEDSLNEINKIGESSLLPLAYKSLGDLYFNKDVIKAEDYYKKALDIAMDLGQHHDILRIKLKLTEIKLEEGRFDDAEKELLGLEGPFVKIKATNDLLSIYSDLGHLFEKRTNWKEASKYFKKSSKILMVSDKKSADRFQARSLINIARSHSQTGQNKEASGNFKQASECIDDPLEAKYYEVLSMIEESESKTHDKERVGLFKNAVKRLESLENKTDESKLKLRYDLKKKYCQARINMMEGTMLFESRKYLKANDRFQRAKELFGDLSTIENVDRELMLAFQRYSGAWGTYSSSQDSIKGINKAISELLKAYEWFPFEFLKESVKLVVLKWKKDTSLTFGHLDEYQNISKELEKLGIRETEEAGYFAPVGLEDGFSIDSDSMTARSIGQELQIKPLHCNRIGEQQLVELSVGVGKTVFRRFPYKDLRIEINGIKKKLDYQRKNQTKYFLMHLPPMMIILTLK